MQHAEAAVAAPTQPRPRLVFFHSHRCGRCRRIEGYIAQIMQARRNHDAFTHVRVYDGTRLASVIHLAAYYDFSGAPSEKYEEVTVAADTGGGGGGTVEPGLSDNEEGLFIGPCFLDALSF